MSTTLRALLAVLKSSRGRGYTTAFLPLKDLTSHRYKGSSSENMAYYSYPCQRTLRNEDGEHQNIHEIVPWPPVSGVATASKMDKNDENMTMGLQRKQRNRYTKEDHDKIIDSSLTLAVSLKALAEANVDSNDLEDQGRGI